MLVVGSTEGLTSTGREPDWSTTVTLTRKGGSLAREMEHGNPGIGILTRDTLVFLRELKIKYLSFSFTIGLI